MNDTEDADQWIGIASTNPLIGTIAPAAATLTNVSAVLSVLSELSLNDECSRSKDYNYGMYLIYSWLRSTLKYVAQAKQGTTP